MERSTGLSRLCAEMKLSPAGIPIRPTLLNEISVVVSIVLHVIVDVFGNGRLLSWSVTSCRHICWTGLKKKKTIWDSLACKNKSTPPLLPRSIHLVPSHLKGTFYIDLSPPWPCHFLSPLVSRLGGGRDRGGHRGQQVELSAQVSRLKWGLWGVGGGWGGWNVPGP